MFFSGLNHRQESGASGGGSGDFTRRSESATLGRPSPGPHMPMQRLNSAPYPPNQQRPPQQGMQQDGSPFAMTFPSDIPLGAGWCVALFQLMYSSTVFSHGYIEFESRRSHSLVCSWTQ